MNGSSGLGGGAGSTPPPYRPPSSQGPGGSSHGPQPPSQGPVATPKVLLTPGLQARYAVQGELGRGGMGVVYLAHDRQRGVEVALKVLLAATLTEVQRTRFLREGDVTSKLVHPGVVRLLEHGEVEGQPFLAYELIVGARSLTEAAAGRRFWDRILLVRDAARALGFAHRQGVIHRDVKPDNLLVGGDGRLRVTDFGLAALEGGQRMTRTGALIGTPHYMSPEQFAGAKMAEVDARADVWALGVCLYEVAAGRVPFQGETLVEVGGAICNASYVPLSEVAQEAPPAFDALVARTLAQDPEQRFADGEAMAEALDRFLDGQSAPAGKGRARGLLLGGLGLCSVLGAAALAGTSGVFDRPRAAASPAPSLSPSATPNTSAEDVLGVRALARGGQLKQALTQSSSFSSTPGRVLYVELLLEAGQNSEAASELQTIPTPERGRLEALRLLLAGRDPRQALEALGSPQGPEAELVRAVASFLVDPQASPELEREWISRRALVDFARGEVLRLKTRDRDPSSYLLRAGSYKGDMVAARREILARAQSKGLWGGHILERVLRADIQESLHPFFMLHLVIWGNTSIGQAEWFADLQLALDLLPEGPSARRLTRLQRGMHLCKKGRIKEATVRAALEGTPEEDPRGELFGVPAADRWFQLLISYVAHPRPDRRALADEVLRSRTPQFDSAGRLRRELCLHLARTERRVAYDAFVAGQASEGRAAQERAEAAALKQLERILYWKKRSSDNLMRRDREEVGLTLLFCGKLKETKPHFKWVRDERLRAVYRGEVLMAQGKLQAAGKLLLPLLKDGKPRPPELSFQLVHLTLLLGDAEQAKVLLKTLPPDLVSERLPWRSSEASRELLEGRGWWPGQN